MTVRISTKADLKDRQGTVILDLMAAAGKLRRDHGTRAVLVGLASAYQSIAVHSEIELPAAAQLLEDAIATLREPDIRRRVKAAGEIS